MFYSVQLFLNLGSTFFAFLLQKIHLCRWGCYCGFRGNPFHFPSTKKQQMILFGLERLQHLLTGTLPLAYWRLNHCQIHSIETANIFLCSVHIYTFLMLTLSHAQLHSHYKHACTHTFHAFWVLVWLCITTRRQALFEKESHRQQD